MMTRKGWPPDLTTDFPWLLLSNHHSLKPIIGSFRIQQRGVISRQAAAGAAAAFNPTVSTPVVVVELSPTPTSIEIDQSINR
jgi:hypothetical protein